jgi:hypothetical protein
MIAERAEFYSLATRHRLFQAGHSRDDPSPPQPFGGVILIVDHDIQEIPGVLYEVRRGRYEPGSEAVGVRCDIECRPLFRFGRIDEHWEMLEQFAFEHAHVVNVPAEPFALLRRDAGAAPLDQDSSEALLQLLYSLRDGGGRHVQDAGGFFKASGLDDRRNGSESRIVEHGLALFNLA